MSSKLVSGGEGPQRFNYTKERLDEVISLNQNKEIIIYDATYQLVSYISNPCVSYYCVDSVVAFVDKMKEEIARKKADSSYKTYLFCDAYGGFMFAKDNHKMFMDILNNKELYNFEILMSARHMDFVPEDFVDKFDETIRLDEIYTKLSNKI